MTTGMPWFRLYTEFMDDPKLGLLAFEDQRHYVIVLCMKGAGLLDAKYRKPEHREATIARKLGVTVEVSKEILRRLEDVLLVDSSWQPLAWDERQMRSDTSKERTAKWRQRHARRHSDVTGDVTETAQDTDTDEDSERLSVGTLVPSSRTGRVRKPAKNRSAELKALVAGATKRLAP